MTIVFPTILSLISGLLGVGITIYLQRNMRFLKFSGDGMTVLEESPHLEGISVVCMGTQVPRVTRSILRVWNAGFGAIKPVDVVPSNPLVISVDQDSQILTAKIIKSTEEAVGFEIQPRNERECLLTFPYWGKNQGVVIELQHTSKQIVPNLRGTIEDCGRIKSLGRVATGPVIGRRNLRYHWALPIAGLSLMTIAVSIALKFHVPLTLAGVLTVLLLGIGELLFLATYADVIARFCIPKGLR
jgi:hypothetical protein